MRSAKNLIGHETEIRALLEIGASWNRIMRTFDVPMSALYKFAGKSRYKRGRVARSLKVRFWEKVQVGEADECWRWLGAYGKGRYGHIVGDDGKHIDAHKASYILAHGSIPDGLVVRHTCDNRWCVNPKHLIVGTDLDNSRDYLERGWRKKCGLTEEKENQIVALRMEQSMTNKQIADAFGLKVNTVETVIRHARTYHVEQSKAMDREQMQERMRP